ncbi:universal stress protein [Sphaerisporangium fuscum]|uniref:universal stress protein n=1 Tax=Sphaerisporangium fuscum TaxID=2835868 RepID=UPI001BDD360C|nr:universal stress protein [Sphaerisporangium fuscum]
MVGRIVAGVDGSESAAAALEWAADDAARRGRALRIVHVREPWAQRFPFHRVEGFDDALNEYCEGVLAKAAEQARERAPGLPVTTELLTGTVVELLRQEADGAEALVLGSRGMGGFTGMVLGSVGLGVAGHARGPVVVMRGDAPRTPHGEVVVGVDGSAQSEAALRYAFEQAASRRSRVHALYAWTMAAYSPLAIGYADAMRDVLEAEVRAVKQWLAPWREKYPDVPLAESDVCGHPVPALVEASRSADLVVVGSRGLGGFGSALLGSVSHGVLHHAHCPVAVVRPRDQEA